MRFLLTISLLGALLLTACDGDGAAVDVRWLIVDLTTGALAKPNDSGISHPDGSCGVDEPDASALSSWHIEQVRLVLANPSTGREIFSFDGGSGPLLFNCDQREAITPFSLPTGTFALSLVAVNNHLDDPSVVTPAPSVRMLKAAEVVNLDVQELGIHPVPLAPTIDGGAPDLSISDSGPVP